MLLYADTSISYVTLGISYIEDIRIFGMNMPFISSSEAKNAYFMSGEATNEIYIFSPHEMKLMAYSFQKFEFSFYYIQV